MTESEVDILTLDETELDSLVGSAPLIETNSGWYWRFKPQIWYGEVNKKKIYG